MTYVDQLHSTSISRTAGKISHKLMQLSKYAGWETHEEHGELEVSISWTCYNQTDRVVEEHKWLLLFTSPNHKITE